MNVRRKTFRGGRPWYTRLYTYTTYIYLRVSVRTVGQVANTSNMRRRTYLYIYIYTVHVGVCTYKRPLTISCKSTGLFFFVDYGRENRDRMHRSVALYSPVRFPPPIFFHSALRFFCSMTPFLYLLRPNIHDCGTTGCVDMGVVGKTSSGANGNGNRSIVLPWKR